MFVRPSAKTSVSKSEIPLLKETFYRKTAFVNIIDVKYMQWCDNFFDTMKTTITSKLLF